MEAGYLYTLHEMHFLLPVISNNGGVSPRAINWLDFHHHQNICQVLGNIDIASNMLGNLSPPSQGSNRPDNHTSSSCSQPASPNLQNTNPPIRHTSAPTVTKPHLKSRNKPHSVNDKYKITTRLKATTYNAYRLSIASSHKACKAHLEPRVQYPFS